MVQAEQTATNTQILASMQSFFEAEAKLTSYKNLKSELEADMADIVGRLEELRYKVRENRRTEQNPKGQLVQRESEYVASLQLDLDKLANLLARDLAHW